MVSMVLCERYSDLLTRNMMCKMHGDEKMYIYIYINTFYTYIYIYIFTYLYTRLSMFSCI